MPKKVEVLETKMVGLAGNKNQSTSVLGDPTAAKVIAEQSVDVVRRFSQAVFKLDFDTAYALCATEFRSSKSARQFVALLRTADQEFGGPAIDLKMERITWIYADAASRQRPNSNGDWPKDTPKENKRALVGAEWFVDEKHGRSAFFWVTEEADGYHVTKFKQYVQ